MVEAKTDVSGNRCSILHPTRYLLQWWYGKMYRVSPAIHVLYNCLFLQKFFTSNKIKSLIYIWKCMWISIYTKIHIAKLQKHVFTKYKLADQIKWRLYLHGSYSSLAILARKTVLQWSRQHYINTGHSGDWWFSNCWATITIKVFLSKMTSFETPTNVMLACGSLYLQKKKTVLGNLILKRQTLSKYLFENIQLYNLCMHWNITL